MNQLLTDVWHDLRDKRLWPVAAALVVALVAVPILLVEPVKEPAVERAATPRAPAAPGTKLAGAETGKGSALDVFDAKDPFRPPGAVLDASKSDDSGSGRSGESSAAGADRAPDGGGAGGGAGGGSGPEGSGGGAGPSPPSTGPTPPATGSPRGRMRAYTYVVDVTFGTAGRTRRYRGVRRLELLPNKRDPLLVFLGVDASGARAVFLVDSTLRSTGEEGTCEPSAEKCGFLYIEPGELHTFVDEDGKSHLLRIDQLRKVSVAVASSARARQSSPGGGARAFGARTLGPPPTFTDVVAGG